MFLLEHDAKVLLEAQGVAAPRGVLLESVKFVDIEAQAAVPGTLRSATASADSAALAATVGELASGYPRHSSRRS